jgi:plastocyanin
VRAVRPWARLVAAGVVIALALGAGCAGPRAGLQGQLQTSPGRKTRASIEDTIVYLVSDKPEQAAATAPPADATLLVDDNGLHPAVLAVAAGTNVAFRNKSDVFHKMFSISPTQPFDAGPLGPGEEHAVLFDHAGEIHVFCELHPQESAYIYVTPTAQFTRMDSHGRFHFAVVAPGPYTLRTWHPERGETSQAIVVPKHGELQVTVTD